MAGESSGLLESIIDLPVRFAEIAAQSPEQAILLLVGALITAGASVVFGVLSFGGLASVLAQVLPSGEPPEEYRESGR
ncbi:hypothetical protein [Halosegnis sp.]|uniref:hypothetical protein n=1 Tax=Halosegnis sp. TaxID=2864959 RepID=UPI0035D4DC7D